MKKYICILLLVVFVMSLIPAFGEANRIEGDFSIRSGVKFGMTIDEVDRIETEVNGLPAGTRQNDSDLYYGVETLAGISGLGGYDDLWYTFDKSTGQMNYFRYDFGRKTSHYEELKANIIGKYGNPIHDNDGNIFPIITDGMKTFLKRGLRISPYCEWLLQFDDCYVVMDLWVQPDYDQMVLGYMRITNEEMEQLMLDSAVEDAEKNASRDNDI